MNLCPDNATEDPKSGQQIDENLDRGRSQPPWPPGIPRLSTNLLRLQTGRVRTLNGMGRGQHRSDVDYVWPAAIELPARGPVLVYLDLNFWIGLARAHKGMDANVPYTRLLNVLRELRSSSQITVPLSGMHYMETSSIRDPRQRADIAAVMEELSGFRTLLCRSLVMRLEIEAVLDQYVGPRDVPYQQLPLLGFGVGHAFGKRGGLRIRSEEGEDVTEQVRRDWPDGVDAFDREFAQHNLLLERGVLQGPADEDLPELRLNGFVDRVAKDSQERRAQQEREQAARLGPDDLNERDWRKGRLSDIVLARYVIVEAMDMLLEGLDGRGRALANLFPDGEPDEQRLMREFVDAMPGADVYVSLVTAKHRNPESAWTSNDIVDIDALSLAVPYCDIVATDKERAHQLRTTGVAHRLGTVVVANPGELLRELERLAVV